MTAAALKSWRPSDRTSDAADLTPHFMGGILIGFFAAIVSLLVDMVILIGALNISGVSETGNPWADWGLAVMGAVSIAVTLVVGRWLYGLRRSVGADGDPMDHDTMTRKRRAFVAGATVVHVPMAPLVWLTILAIALSP